MKARGLLQYEISDYGHLINNNSNLEKTRLMFLDRKLINNDLLGPGDPGDFDLGAWHVLCHLAAGCAVYKRKNDYLWIEISHIPSVDLYTATISVSSIKESVVTFPLLSEEGVLLLKDAKLLGFVEGSSLGHISARDVIDNEIRFNKWKRQDFDKGTKSEDDGGRVWEHWCTVRDLTPTADLGLSVLKAYLSIVSLCGGINVSLVARGRQDYNHPEQLIALVKYGFISEEDALMDITPKPISKQSEQLIYSAQPIKCLEAVKTLPWEEGKISYFMFSRRIKKWNPLSKVKEILLKK